VVVVSCSVLDPSVMAVGYPWPRQRQARRGYGGVMPMPLLLMRCKRQGFAAGELPTAMCRCSRRRQCKDLSPPEP